VSRLDVALDGLHTSLLLEDRKVPPHVLRQFFERSGREDDGELVPLLSSISSRASSRPTISTRSTSS